MNKKELLRLIQEVESPTLCQKEGLLKETVTKFFSQKEKSNSAIITMLNEALANSLSEDVEENPETIIKFPKIKITERWGEKNNEDRALLESMMKNVQGHTIQEKIKSVNQFLDYKKDLTIPQILSNLLFVEIFSSIMDEFNYATSGFLFEAFLAGLFQGVQISDASQVGESGSLPIEDVRLAIQNSKNEEIEIVPYSLKVLSASGGTLKGSFRSLVDYFADESEGRKNDKIVYLVVVKEGEGTLAFHEFTITLDNFLEYIGAAEHKDQHVEMEYEISPQDTDLFQTIKKTGFIKPTTRSSWKDYFEKQDLTFLHSSTRSGIHDKTTGEDIPWGAKIEPDHEYIARVSKGMKFLPTGGMSANQKKLYGENYRQVEAAYLKGDKRGFLKELVNSRGYRKQEQFKVAPTFYRHRDKSDFLGRLDLYGPHLIKVANRYAKDLGDNLIIVYNSLNDLTNNISKYFLLEEAEESRKQHGIDAIRDAHILNENTKKVVEGFANTEEV
jgi:hypothetical protein